MRPRTRPSSGRLSLLVRAGVVVLAVVLAILPMPSGAVERFYSNGFFPILQAGVTPLSNLVPFAVFDALVLIAGVGWVGLLVRDVLVTRRGAGGWFRVAGWVTVRTVTLVAVFYLAFLVAWGFNYRRVPLVQRFASEPLGPTTERAERLAMAAVDQLNALYAEAHGLNPGDVPVDGSLARAFAQVQEQIGIARQAHPARPKVTLFDPYFRSAGVAGMTDPYFLETLVATDLLPFERPFVIAHEWSHLAGVADEGEANFLGWLTCTQGAAPDRYSGWLFLYDEVAAGLPRASRTSMNRRLEAGPRGDLQAIADRVKRNVRPRVARAGWQVYDSYLKANRVEAGAASYRDVVRLVLSVHFDSRWVPALK